MANYQQITESGLIKSTHGKLTGVIVNSHTSGTLKLTDGNENGVAATGTLTSTGACAPADYATATLTSDGTNFSDKVKATGTLTSTGAMVPGVHASTTLTTDETEIADGETVTIGAIVYRFKDTMAQAYDVKRDGTTAATTLANLALAINGTGTAGVNYFAGTVAHPYVRSSGVVTNALTITARTVGNAAFTATINGLETTETTSHLTFPDSTLGGGTGDSTPAVTTDDAKVTIDTRTYSVVTALSETSGAAAVADQVLYGGSVATMLDNLKLAINAGATAGTNYSTGTVVHATVTATTNANDSQVVEAKVAGTAANAIVTTETMANTSWGAATLAGGLEAETVTIGTTVYTFKDTTATAYDVKIGIDAATTLDNLELAINASGVGDGTDYHAGTLAHPLVIATTNGDTTQVIRAKIIGTAPNAYATTETCAHAAFGGATMGSGVAVTAATVTIDGIVYTATKTLPETLGFTPVPYYVLWVTNEATFLDNLKLAINESGVAGTNYSAGTVEHPTVTATTNANDSQVVQAKLTGTGGNAIATTDTLDNYAWGATTLAGGTGDAISSIIMDTYTLPTGSSVINFNSPLYFDRGLYAVIGGTAANLTIMYE